MMKKLIVFLLLFSNCSQSTVMTALNDDILKKQLGNIITVEGMTSISKLGPKLLAKDGGSIWIDTDNPPKYFHSSDPKGVTKRVTGLVIEKYDLPVFIQEPRKASDKSVGARGSAGIPVPPGTDLKKASHRYLLANASWEIISD